MHKISRNFYFALLLALFLIMPAVFSIPYGRPIAQSGIQSKSSEDIYREMVIAQTQERIKRNNQLYGEFFISVHNQFSAYTQQQFKKLFLGGRMSQQGSMERRHVEGASDQQKGNLRKDLSLKPGLLNAIVPKIINLDYSKSTRPRLVTPVKSQGSCGSCWAFAGIAEIESYFLSKYKLFLDLSEQQMVDCLPAVQKGNLGCGGGFLDSVGYYASLYPIAQQKYYKYTGKQAACNTAKINQGKTFKIKSYAYTYDCLTLVNALINLRPIGVCGGVDDNWMNYGKGVMPVCNVDYNGGHCFLLVGVVADGTNNKLTNWYKFKNSWGTWWGEEGYIRIYRDTFDNKVGPCGVCDWGGIYSI